jgi:Peptidase A4 family
MSMNRRTRLAAAIAAAASVVTLGTASAASAGTHPGTAAAAARAARAALRHMTANQPVTDQVVPGTRHRSGGLTKVSFYNWSGYADDSSKGNTYSKVSGSWSEPAITCPTKEFQVAVFWVGIDGYNGSTVEQDGTLAECYKGKAHYYTWWEMYPTNEIQTVGDTVKPGDKIAGSVVKSGTSYALKLTDSTTSGNNISTTQTCAASTCIDASAEWIAETPSYARGYAPLPDFKTWKVSSASVTSGSKTGTVKTFPDDEITMVGDAGYALATPGALNSAGTGFTDTWDNSYQPR